MSHIISNNTLTKVLGKIFRFAVPVAISVTLVIWLLHKIDINRLKEIIVSECDFIWIAMMMLITVVSHVIRGIRWGIQLRGAGLKRVSVIIESISIFGAYALNLIFSEVGEAWRCVFMAKQENARLSTVVGTDLGDRISDAAVIILLSVLTMIVAGPYMEKFLDRYSFVQHTEAILKDPWLWIGIVIAISLIWFLFHFGHRLSVVRKIDGTLNHLWNGFAVLFTMKGKGLYLLLTLGIWICYFMETYVGFHAFPFTRALINDPGSAYGLIPGLVVFVFGSFSMAVPSNGGLGPWNLAVMFALSLYGIERTEGLAYTIVMWGCQAATLIALGIFSMVYIMLQKKRNDKNVVPDKDNSE